MLTTPQITSTPPPAGTADAPRPASSARLAGVGALAFTAIVILQNVIRGSSAPTNGAPTDEVLRHAADTRSLTFVLVATFVLSGISLATFLGGVMRRLTAGARPAAAYAGYAGAAGVLALFAVVVASEQAISVIADGAAPDHGAVAALWTLHNSVFTVLQLFIAVALLGLGRAGVAAGITPRTFEWLAPVGVSTARPRLRRGPGHRRWRARRAVRPRAGRLRDLARLPAHDRPAPRARRWRPGRGVPGVSAGDGRRDTTMTTTTNTTATTAAIDLSTDPTDVASGLVAHLERTWNRADGSAFGAAFADDSDFVDIRGVHHVGRAAIAAGHQAIFDSIYAGSTVDYELERAREIAPGCVVGVVAATLEAPHGPLQGTTHARFTLTITDLGERWAISAFHNTLVAAR